MKTDLGLEHEVAAAFHEAAPSREPDRLFDTIISDTGRMRPRPRWLALFKEPPMRYRSQFAVGSPTFRAASVLAITVALLLALAAVVVAGASLLPSPPAGPRTIVVDQSGHGNARTIAEALDMAVDGETLLLRPGTYAEHVVTDKDITLTGDPGAPREAVVIEFTLESPEVISYYGVGLPNAITLDKANATVRHLTIAGPNYGIGVQVDGGQVLVEDLGVTLTGEFTGKGRYALHITNGAVGTVRDVTCSCSIGINGGATPSVEDIHLSQDVLILDGTGTNPAVSDSEIEFVWVQDGAMPSVTGNTITGSISVSVTGAPEISGNTFEGGSNSDPYGLHVEAASPHLAGNTIRGEVTGIDVAAGAAPTIEGNVLEDNTTGIAIAGPASAIPPSLVITGNTFCGNGTDLSAPANSTLTLDGNEVCEPGASVSP